MRENTVIPADAQPAPGRDPFEDKEIDIPQTQEVER